MIEVVLIFFLFTSPIFGLMLLVVFDLYLLTIGVTAKSEYSVPYTVK